MRIQGGSNSLFGLLASPSTSSSEGTEEKTKNSEAATADIALAEPAERSLDFTQMTSKEMQAAATQMWKDGEIDLTQLLILQNAGIPLGKVGDNGEFIPLSESEKDVFRQQPLNFLEILQNGVKSAEAWGGASNPQSGYSTWKDLFQTLSGKLTGVDLFA